MTVKGRSMQEFGATRGVFGQSSKARGMASCQASLGQGLGLLWKVLCSGRSGSFMPFVDHALQQRHAKGSSTEVVSAVEVLRQTFRQSRVERIVRDRMAPTKVGHVRGG